MLSSIYSPIRAPGASGILHGPGRAATGPGGPERPSLPRRPRRRGLRTLPVLLPRKLVYMSTDVLNPQQFQVVMTGWDLDPALEPGFFEFEEPEHGQDAQDARSGHSPVLPANGGRRTRSAAGPGPDPACGGCDRRTGHARPPARHGKENPASYGRSDQACGSDVGSGHYRFARAGSCRAASPTGAAAPGSPDSSSRRPGSRNGSVCIAGRLRHQHARWSAVPQLRRRSLPGRFSGEEHGVRSLAALKLRNGAAGGEA